ncbi:MAG: DUF1553 domain-containing protein [Planctomycetaceae bacterium]|jgi:hypothetical protein|nr:DUF1553 domain-containing protein [Planctomycetaceae bacterium]
MQRHVRTLTTSLLLTMPLCAAEPVVSRLTVEPAAVELSGRRQRVQLVVSGHRSDGSVIDLTHQARVTVEHRGTVGVQRGRVLPLANGTTRLTISASGQVLQLPVRVQRLEQTPPVSFRNGLLASLSKQGCNSGGCHGSPSGKGGFRLSLRAFDPTLDAQTLIREQFARRVNVFDPDKSLLLRKPTLQVAHGGGQQLRRHDPAYELIRDWIADGCPRDAEDSSRCVRTEVFPRDRFLKSPAVSQQLKVVAHFSDGSSRDVTHLAVYSSSNETLAEVDVAGRVTGTAVGQVGILVRFLDQMQATRLTFLKDRPGFVWNEPPVINEVDRHTFARLKEMQIVPSPLLTDGQFLRRVTLDVTGLLPTVKETRAFLADRRPDRRARLIAGLLAGEDHARFWAGRWADLFRMTRKQLGSTGVDKFHRWLVAAVRDNMPYDRFVRSLLTAQGDTFANPAANYYRAATDVEDATETTARHFLGIRIQCAKCHNHPYERWTQENYYGIAAFFNRVRRGKPDSAGNLVVWVARSGEISRPRGGNAVPWLPLTGNAKLPDPESDRRLALADWLVRKDNPLFARVEVNRLWSMLCGRGIIEPIDDFRASNPPANPPLLDWLAGEFQRSDFDRRHILSLILNSRTYQLDSLATDQNRHDQQLFSHAVAHRLSAEQVLDAICQVSQVPEQFGKLPAGTRATQLATPEDAPAFLRIFGKPSRETSCDCERQTGSTLSQHLTLVNGSLVSGKITHGKNRFRRLISAGRGDREILEDLYLAAFCRLPNSEELRVGLEYVGGAGNREKAHEDIQWAVINSREFLFRN